jgi:hypothetical protein
MNLRHGMRSNSEFAVRTHDRSYFAAAGGSGHSVRF